MRNICLLLIIVLFSGISLQAEVRKKYNFNPEWKLYVGDPQGAEQPNYDDASWKSVTLPHAFNEDDAFRVAIDKLATGVAWYRKRFRLPADGKGQKVFIEFEGIRQAGEFFINGTAIGMHENGVMAVGFDLTPYARFGKENVIAVRIDNSWDYKEKSTGAKFQWNDKNFNANYGGIPKNVYLHLTGKLYQTLPLFSNLGTTGVYVYADNIVVKARTADIHAESEVRNEHSRPVTFACEVEVKDMDGALLGKFAGERTTIASGETKTVKASAPLSNLNFWSWGYGYLYTVETALVADGKEVDRVKTRTGFRKTRFANGMVWLNDRVIQLKGYAQRTSNEWPAAGLSVPAWMSDYSNGLMVESNANLVRWMHVTPWRQDVESCDRVGLMQAMPAGDSEKDVADARWQQRTHLMRDAIIYNRNSPSVIFYESGNESVSEEHMAEMKAIRDRYDPHGGRAIGSREMLDSRVAEYGGEMLYINKSARIPVWATEYSRDEGLRKYRDSYSYPFHKDGEGPPYRGADASAYNRNQDSHAIENIVRWFDYWRERPGTGRRVSSGGVKIIFSDSNTHFRGAENYRRSGVTDPMRIPKDGFFAHQVMWDGWVDVEKPRTHIMGHWNYGDSVVKDIFVVSGGCQKVELLVNGASKGFGSKSHEFLYTFKNVAFARGELKALAYDAQGRVVSSDTLLTVGNPEAIRLTLLQGAHGFYADGADMVMVEVEVVDGSGRRCPLANDEVSFELSGHAEWRGGIAQGRDNYILSKTLPVECGVNRALIRSTPQAGTIRLTASSGSLKPASVDFASTPADNLNGLSEAIQAERLPPVFRRGATPSVPSYAVTRIPVEVKSATAGANSSNAIYSYDDNELSEWRNNGAVADGWITYELEREARINEVTLKLTGWRMRSYPISIFADSVQVFSGSTEKSLGYVTIPVKEAKAKTITIRLVGNNTENDAFGQVVELAGGKELDMYGVPNVGQAKGELRIVEAEFYELIGN
ncbi:MAG: DUF4982 domain-containing protein [Prevotellaceae bacterium]|jgi:hypothetical protein|nr:DUF4982 domain-containing protein [Prevotellaceae bacterium]